MFKKKKQKQNKATEKKRFFSFLRKSPKVKSYYMQISGLNAHYYKCGFNPFSKIVFLHGLGGGSGAYKDLIELLAKNHEVYALDFPSYGKTQHMSDVWTISDFANYSLEFIKKLNIGKIKLMGHSAGGLVTIELASNPDSQKYIKKVILVDSAGLPKSKSDLEFVFKLAFLNPINHFFEMKKNLKLNSFYRIAKNSIFMLKRNIKTKNKNLFKSIIKNWSHTCEDKLKTIKQPTHIIWGTKDEVFPIADAYYIKKSISKSKLSFVDGYHNWTSFTPELGKDIFKKL